VSKLSASGPGDLDLKFSPPAVLLGLLAASLQIFLLREFAAQFYGNELVFGLVLASWLLWGGCGSLWASGREPGRKGLAVLFFGVLLVAPVCFAALRFSRFILGILPGELIGLGPILLFAFVLSFFLNFPLGAIFVFTVKRDGHLPRVYFWESFGAAAGGLLTYLALIPLLSNWQALAVIGGLASMAVFFFLGGRKAALVFSLALAAHAALFFSDLPAQKLVWRPFALVRTKDSLYGKLQVIRTSEQVTLYDNSLRVYSFPDLASAEESVHFAMLQRPEAGRVLLIGGGAGGSLAEILKYPRTEVDYVELDPEIIRLSELFHPDAEKGSLRNPRAHLIYDDGRAFLGETPTVYDVVILNLPEPATAQINRFYTREFFARVREKLAEGGVFSFRVPSAENYIGPELQKFLSIMANTLKQAFPVVKVVPGDSNVFLASAGLLTVEAEDLIRALRRLDLKNRYVTPERLPARLHPLRVEALRTKIDAGPAGLNSDLRPVSYFFNSVLWSTQFKGLESKALLFLARIPAGWMLGVPFLMFIGLLVFIGWRGRRSAISAVPLALMGLTTMAGEIMILIWFQALYGFLYRQVALILTTFMAGLALGALAGTKRKRLRYRQIVLLQFGLLLLVLAMRLALDYRPPQIVPLAFLLLLGYLGGDFFIVSNLLFFKDKGQAGLGYGWDLLGSCAAAVGLSAILVPLAGLPVLFLCLFLVNAFGWLFLVLRRKDHPPPPGSDR